jgi:hypothetical protein
MGRKRGAVLSDLALLLRLLPVSATGHVCRVCVHDHRAGPRDGEGRRNAPHSAGRLAHPVWNDPNSDSAALLRCGPF